MKTQTLALVALASSAQLVSATFSWKDAKKYSCPANTNNICVESQKGGFNWAGLNIGSFSGYGGFDFKGFDCVDSFDGKSKRDQITGRTFQNKCIKGKATPEKASAPSFGCGSSKEVEKFSVKEFQVSVEFDCHLEFHYDMPDGSTCKQKSYCKKSGTTVKNTQCGGAKTVKVIYPKGDNGGKKSSCDIGFHHIDFDCSPPVNTKPPSYSTTTTSHATSTTTHETSTTTTHQASSTTTLETSSTTAQETSSTTAHETSSTTAHETSSTTAHETSSTTAHETSSTTAHETSTTSSANTSAASTSVSSESPVTTTSSIAYSSSVLYPANTTTTTTTAPGETLFTTSTIFETQISTIISCAETVKNCPAASTVLTTITTAIRTTICPVTASTTPSSQATVESSSSTPGSADTTLITTPSPVTTSEAPVTTAPCPEVLPQCLNTWLFSSGCKSNTDTDCFCRSSDFVESVYQCLAAHGASDEEVDSAQKYFQGICAPQIPSNPAIVTGVNTITITASPVYSVPVTTVEILTTIVVPCTQTEGPSAGSPIPNSSTTTVLSTAVTVPQVVFETITGTSTAEVSLVQGTAPAETGNGTPAPAPTTLTSVPVSNGTAVVSPPAQFTGAASKNILTAGSLFAAGLAAILAM